MTLVARNSLATSVYNTPSDPIAQLPEAFPISVAHNNQTRVGVLGDVRGFLGVAINLDQAAGGRPSSPVENQSALYFAASRAFKYVMLIADHHHGVVSNYLHQTHLSAARYTTHRAYSLASDEGRFIWHYEDVVKGTRPPIIHKHVWLQCWEIRHGVRRATPSGVGRGG